MPRKSAISFVSCGCALPEKTFRSPKPVDINPSPLSGLLILLDPADVPRPLWEKPRPCAACLRARLAHGWRAGRRGRLGWGGRIRTFEYGIQSPAPYRLATPHHVAIAYGLLDEGRWKPLV